MGKEKIIKTPGKRQVFLKRRFPNCLPLSRVLSSGCPPIFHPHNVCFGFTFGILNCFPFYSATSPREESKSGKINYALCSIEGAKKGLKSNFRILSTEKKFATMSVQMFGNSSSLAVNAKRVLACTNTLGENLSNICYRSDIYTEILASHPPRSFPFHNTQGW